jgi:hypothetical protein
MTKHLKILAISAVLLVPASTARAQISFGIQIGEPPAPRVYRVAPRPGPEFLWVEGYWYPEGRRYKWHDGYWTRAPYDGAYWVEPYYWRGEYFGGHWEGSRGELRHDHRWDRGRDRDWRRDERREDRREDRRDDRRDDRR